MDLVDRFLLRPAGENTIPTNDALIDWSSRAVSIFSSAACTWKRDYNFYSAFRLDASNIVGVTNARKWAPFWSLAWRQFPDVQVGFSRWFWHWFRSCFWLRLSCWLTLW